MNVFTIRDIENLSGIKAHTIRIWEQRYSFLNPKRTDTNIRYYTNDELKKVLNISILNKYGYKISHINKMSAGEIKEKILLLSQVEAQQERICNELVKSMIDLNADAFESTLDSYIHQRGIEKTIIYIIFPFLERVGILWHTHIINAAQEHLISNIIRQKLIAGIQNTISHLAVNKTVLLFLPEDEHHELGLLFIHYLLKSRGVKVLYIGADVPQKDIEYIVKTKKPDILYTHLSSVARNFNFEKFIAKTISYLNQNQLAISGRPTQSFKKKLPPNVQLNRSLHEVMEYVSKIDS